MAPWETCPPRYHSPGRAGCAGLHPCAESTISLPNALSRLNSTPDLTDLYVPSLFSTALLGYGRLALLQGIFPTKGPNPGLQFCRWALYHQNHEGSPTYTSQLHSPHVSALPRWLEVIGQMPHTHHICRRMDAWCFILRDYLSM